MIKNLLSPDHDELDSIFDELLASFTHGDAEEVYRKLDFFWARLAMHIRAENLHLFPSILKAVQKGEPTKDDLNASAEFVRETLQQLENDHNFFMRELGDAVKQMRQAERRDASGKLNDLREKIDALGVRLERHNELEEIYVYSWAETFAPAEKSVLRSKIQKELENLPPRFRK